MVIKNLFLISILVIASTSSRAQWEPDVRLTDATSLSCTSYSNAWCIAASGDTVHVAWEDKRSGTWQVFYKRSIDGGISWGEDTPLTDESITSRGPSIVVVGPAVHLFWFSWLDENFEMMYIRSLDGGNNWESNVRLTNTPGDAWCPSAAESGSSLHVVWADNRDAGINDEIYYKRSLDGGLTWDSDIRLTNDTVKSHLPCVSASGSVVHVVWEDYRNFNFEIYYIRSNDEGITWGPIKRLTFDPAGSGGPCIAAVDSAVHVVWSDQRYGQREIYYKRSCDGGIIWGPDKRLTNTPGAAYSPSIAAAGSNLHVVWYDTRDGNEEIYYKHTEDAGVSWNATDTRLTDAAEYSVLPSVAVSGSAVHVVWNDGRDGNAEVYYKRNPTGNFPVGIGNYLAGNSRQHFSIYPNPASSGIQLQFNDEQIFPTGQGSETHVLSIRNILGETMMTRSIRNTEAVIDVSMIPNGFYFAEIATPNKPFESQRLIIRK